MKNIKNTIIYHRRWLHQHPELSFKEFNTSEYICDVLKSLDVKFEVIADTGIVAIIGEDKKHINNCVAFRAELDAIPIKEKTNLDFASLKNDIMHACGHDMHIAMLLGAIEILQTKKNNLKGCVKIIFQPGEELLPGGGSKMIKLKCLKHPVPKFIFAQHIDPDLDIGCIATKQDTIMSASSELHIKLIGKATHGSTPHLGHNPIVAAANIVDFSQTFLNNYKSPLFKGVLSICSINGGNSNNVIPSEVNLSGTLRVFDEFERDMLLNLLEEKIKLIAKSYDVECKCNFIKGYPPVTNDIAAYALVKKTAIEISNINFKQCDAKMWTEDFAYYLKEVPGCFYFIGIKEPQKEVIPLHSPYLSPSEDILENGVNFIITLLENALNI